MKTLKYYVIEALSTDNKKMLQYLLSKNLIEDDDINKLLSNKKISDDDFNNWKIDETILKRALDFKGLGEKNFSSSYDLSKDLIKKFNKKHKIDKLKSLLSDIKDDDSNAGVYLFNEFKEKSNIYDCCKGWEDVAKEIAQIDTLKSKVGSATIGKFEILLRLIIKDADDLTNGDLHCLNNIPIEVKAAPPNGNSGARINDQSKELEKPTIIYKTLFNELINDNKIPLVGQNDKNKEIILGPKEYFRNQSSPKDILELLLNTLNNNMKDDFLYLEDDNIKNFEDSFYYILVKSIYAQYGWSKNTEEITECAKIIKNINLNSINFINFKNNKYNINSDNLINIVGAIQLLLYCKADKFKYIIVIDKYNGDFIILSDEDINNIKPTLEKCNFKAIGPASGRAQTCRIGVKKN